MVLIELSGRLSEHIAFEQGLKDARKGAMFRSGRRVFLGRGIRKYRDLNMGICLVCFIRNSKEANVARVNP